MTSSINAGTINQNYPVPGVNNSSQGFRDNFLATKNNFANAAFEISDLQAKAILKSGLGNTGVAPNNDMANTLISNALVQGFRQTTYNLGTNLNGADTVIVDLKNGDYQYGIVAANANISMSFAGWAPAGTYSEVIVSFDVTNSNSYIALPGAVLGQSINTIENYDAVNSTINAPYGVTQLTYVFSTIDCGQTVDITPLDRPRRIDQVSVRPPTAGNDFNLKGYPGDTIGTFVYSNSFNSGLYICTANYTTGATNIWQQVGTGNGGSNATGNSISNGTSNISFTGANGNIVMTVSNANVMRVSPGAVSVTGNITTSGTITAANVITTGTGPVSITSASTITLTGGNRSNVVLPNGTGLNVTGNAYLTPNIVTPGSTTGTAGQIVVDTTNDKIWVCYGGTVWKSATLS
jgi:hypothetical protein